MTPLTDMIVEHNAMTERNKTFSTTCIFRTAGLLSTTILCRTTGLLRTFATAFTFALSTKETWMPTHRAAYRPHEDFKFGGSGPLIGVQGPRPHCSPEGGTLRWGGGRRGPQQLLQHLQQWACLGDTQREER